MTPRDQPVAGSTPFVVLTTQRSGSVLLVQAIQSHPDMFCFHEMLRPKIRNDQSLRAYLAPSLPRRVGRFVRPYATTKGYLDQLFATRDERAVGFKLMYNQLRRHPELWLMFRRGELKVVHLVRSNILHTEVSAVRAKVTGEFHARGEARPSADLIEIPTADLVERLERRDRSIARHRRRLRSIPHLELGYDDLVDRRDEVSQQVCGFLGVEPMVLVTDHTKVTPSDLSRVIANYDDVARHLEKTRFAHLLEG